MARVSNRIKLEQEHGSDEEPVTASKSNITGPQHHRPAVHFPMDIWDENGKDEYIQVDAQLGTPSHGDCVWWSSRDR